jgi:ABC-2 type transport system permease protein
MAVYEHAYRRYAGPLVGHWRRFLVVPRYALSSLLASRAFIVYYLFCWVAPFVGMVLIYLRHNVGALQLFNLSLERARQAFPIDGGFFFRGLEIQTFLAYLLAVSVGPALISPDLRNNGLALYLARPLSRAEYILGKLVVLVALMASITCVPGLLLFLLQGYLEGGGWFLAQANIVTALLVGGGAWMVAVALLTLMVCAWVKWRPVARIVLLILYFVLSAFSHAAEMALGTWWGGMLSISEIGTIIWAHLLSVRPPSEMPAGAAWFALVAGSLCCLGLLLRRVRAYEVVR